MFDSTLSVGSMVRSHPQGELLCGSRRPVAGPKGLEKTKVTGARHDAEDGVRVRLELLDERGGDDLVSHSTRDQPCANETQSRNARTCLKW